MKNVRIRIRRNGEAQIDMEGFHGQGCTEVMNALTAGDKDVKVEDKPELFELDTESEKERNLL